jgi:hypothetical protein
VAERAAFKMALQPKGCRAVFVFGVSEIKKAAAGYKVLACRGPEN